MRISQKKTAKSKSIDFSKIRKPFQGMPKNYLSYGVVGHHDINPAYARIENGKVLVEVTTIPEGDEIIAEMVMDGQGDGFGFYIPVTYGSRVILGFPNSGDDAIILGHITDENWPFPDEVCGVSTVGTPVNENATTAPQYAFLKTPDGTLIAIESGEDADILIHSGASVQIKASPGGQILLSGTTHIGADFSVPPTGATSGPSGSDLPGTVGEDPIPAVSVPAVKISPGPVGVGTVSSITDPTPPPSEGIVRAKDAIGSDITVDPYFWAFITALASHPLLAAVVGPLNPQGLLSVAKTAASHTASDD